MPMDVYDDPLYMQLQSTIWADYLNGGPGPPLVSDAREPLPCPTRLYVERVRAAGGFGRYEQAHLAKLVQMLAPKLGLPTDVVPLVIKYWAHVGFY